MLNKKDKDSTLTIAIQNSQPVELKDLLDMFHGIEEEFKEFLSKHTSRKNRKSIKLYVSEVRNGSQVYELVCLVPVAMVVIQNANALFEFAEHLKKNFQKLLGQKVLPEQIEKSTIDPANSKNLSKIIKPILKDQASQIVLSATYQENHFHYHLPSSEAIDIQNKIDNANAIISDYAKETLLSAPYPSEDAKQLKQIGEVSFNKEKVVFYWSEKAQLSILDSGIIDSIYPKALTVIFDDNNAEEQMKNVEGDPFRFAFIVDVSVETYHGIPIVYKILNLYKKIDTTI